MQSLVWCGAGDELPHMYSFVGCGAGEGRVGIVLKVIIFDAVRGVDGDGCVVVGEGEDSAGGTYMIT